MIFCTPYLNPTNLHFSKHPNLFSKTSKMKELKDLCFHRAQRHVCLWHGRIGKTLEHGGILTWRIIPFSKWLITMVNKSPK